MAQKIAEGELNPITFMAYDKDCLQKLRYEIQGLALKQKKPAVYTVK